MSAGSGTFVAAGLSIDLDTTTDVPTVWTSADDGENWVTHWLPAYSDQMNIRAMAVSGNTVVVIAHIGYGPDFTTAGLITNARAR